MRFIPITYCLAEESYPYTLIKRVRKNLWIGEIRNVAIMNAESFNKLKTKMIKYLQENKDKK